MCIVYTVVLVSSENNSRLFVLQSSNINSLRLCISMWHGFNVKSVCFARLVCVLRILAFGVQTNQSPTEWKCKRAYEQLQTHTYNFHTPKSASNWQRCDDIEWHHLLFALVFGVHLKFESSHQHMLSFDRQGYNELCNFMLANDNPLNKIFFFWQRQFDHLTRFALATAHQTLQLLLFKKDIRFFVVVNKIIKFD